MLSIEHRIAADIAAQPAQVRAAVELLDGGATVPFIARYRKEVTGGLDDTQLRLLEERLGYLRELEDRRAAILASIAEQGKLDDALKAQILEADTKARLEDLYLPYKPKRRTKAQIAREAGLEPLALALREDPSVAPEQRAAAFVDADKGVPDVKAALDGDPSPVGSGHGTAWRVVAQGDRLELHGQTAASPVSALSALARQAWRTGVTEVRAGDAAARAALAALGWS